MRGSLVAAERKQGAGRVGEKGARIRRRVAVGVDQGSRGRLFSLGRQHARLVHGDGTGGHVAVEVEAAQEVAQFLFAHGGRDLHQVPQRGFVVAQHFDLVLGNVADGQALVELRVARQ
ncbi:hypothetical protein G6F57_021076 [Rhizopus arrhizus]|nr:hypothetical protein G6F57_021076 [Rhizopus arrhizus]